MFSIRIINLDLIEKMKKFENMFYKYENEFDLKLKINNNNKYNKYNFNYKLWKTEDLIKWILTLNNGLFSQYCESLLNQKITGKDIINFNKNDLLKFGINNISHSQNLIIHFQNLNNSSDNNN